MLTAYALPETGTTRTEPEYSRWVPLGSRTRIDDVEGRLTVSGFVEPRQFVAGAQPEPEFACSVTAEPSGTTRQR